jgi:hypothetical protein
MRFTRIAQATALALVSSAALNVAFANIPVSGAGFAPMRPVDVSFIQHSPSGVWNISTSDYHWVIGDLGTMAIDTNSATTRFVRVKGRNNGQQLTCWAYFTLTATGFTFGGSATTTANGNFVMDAGATINAGNQFQEVSVQLQCGLPPTPGGTSAMIYSAI